MKVGTGKADITPEMEKIGMLGYGIPQHIVKDIHTRLFARAFYIEPGTAGQPPVAIAVCEIAFITPVVKMKVLEVLAEVYPGTGLSEASLLLVAQHTHSAPGGYSYYPFFNLSTPGLRPEILEVYTRGIAEAIAAAFENRTEGHIRLGSAMMEPEQHVSFNRSLKAYNANTGVEPLDEDQNHLAVHRKMTLLHFSDNSGKALGSLNWYAVHTTSMPNTSYKVHSDNKGYAALYLEEAHRQDGDYVGAFAHGYSGDVTPNYVYDKSRQHNRFWNGPYPDHDRNALYNGRIQFEKAQEIERQLNGVTPLGDHTDALHQWKDMSHMDIDTRYSEGAEGACTSPSCLGVDMFVGTFSDGLGFPDVITPLARSLAKAVRTYEENMMRVFQNERSAAQRRKYQAQGVKDILMETGDNRLFGTADIKNFFMPGVVDKTVEWIKYFAKKGAYDILPMSPQVMPFQLLRIGELAIVAIPFEITTVAGKRLEAVLRKELLRDGVEEVVLCAYANAYNGYITTFEEYQVQAYEGGHTVFGQWSLAAVTQICCGLGEALFLPGEQRSIPQDILPMPTEDQLGLLMY